MISRKQKPFTRGGGTLLPVASLPSNYGIGTFGKAAYEFIDFLKAAKQKYWQVLPLGPTGYGDSPYQNFSAFAGNPYFIDLDILIEENLITLEDVSSVKWSDSPELIDYAQIYKERFKLLKKAFKNSSHRETPEYKKFCEENTFWLGDYSLFMAIKNHFEGIEWLKWPDNIRLREEAALESYNKKLHEEAEFWSFTQFKFDQQWHLLREYARENGIIIIGDIPIYVALDSADTWVNTREFQMDADHRPKLVAGVPPDMFSKTGQLWGNPLYDWGYMKKDNFTWWRKRMKYSAKLYDIIRIDHFIGIVNYYAIGVEETTALNGVWKKGPGTDLLNAINEEIKEAQIIAEDLGVVTKEVIKVLEASGYPGMKLLEFAFDGNPRNSNLPRHIGQNSVVYGGTHDNETLRGYFHNAPCEIRICARKAMRLKSNRELVWKVIEAGYKSKANTAIFQIQDYMELDNTARTNIPSTIGGNWVWRLIPGQATPQLAAKIRKLVEKTKR
ncbi:MAG: 4-alpha-glucanotransferase [Proteocatella sp.]